jgi:DNA-binding LytR/AlgR family response regulator
MTQLRALIVDDEPLVRSELMHAVAEAAADVRTTEAVTALEALAQLQKEPYDVVFLDIRMPGLSGLEAITVINEIPARPQVVFVTAHGHHALDAFEHQAADYLLKPVSVERLRKTLERVRARRVSGARTPSGFSLSRFPVERDGRTLLVSSKDVRFVSARGHDVSVHLFDGDYRFRGTLGECAARLEQHGFLRVHRAYLVNPEHILEVRPFFTGSYVLVTDDKARSEVPVSRAYAKGLRDSLGL